MTDRQSTPSAPQTVLEYGPRPRWRRRRLFRATLILLALGVITAGVWHREYISSRASEMYWFSRCMNHVTPPGTKLVETDPTKAAVLLGSSEDYFDADRMRNLMNFLDTIPDAAVDGTIPLPTLATSQPRAEYIPRELQEFLKQSRPRDAMRGAAVYTGPISTPAGKARLLVLQGAQFEYPNPCNYIRPALIQPPTLLHNAQLIWLGPNSASLPFLAKEAWFKPASLDAKDRTHVIVPFDVYRGSISTDPAPEFSGFVDIYLRSDDSIAISERGKPNSTQIR